jgi:predicted nucleotidyltransferase
MAPSQHNIANAIYGETLEAPTEPPVWRAIDCATERAVRSFLREIESRYFVVEARLYGSRARGDFRPDSDTDIAVILKGQF